MTTKEVPKPQNGSNYTAQEIVQILERAKTLGVAFLKVEGFEATWALERPAPAAVDHSRPAPISDGAPLAHQRGWQEGRARYDGPRRAASLCPDCRDEMKIGKWGKLYCVSCYIASKEARR